MPDPAEQLLRARREGGAYTLPPRSLIRLSGPDAFRYLNGQITRDLGRAGEGCWMPAIILTPKGKICSLLQVLRAGGDVLLECDPAAEEDLLARLDRYLVADDVTVSSEPAPPAVHLFGAVAGPLAGHVPAIGRMGEPGVDLPVGDARIPSLLDAPVVETLRITRGIPRWGSDVDSGTLPPEAGLDRTHIDYDRGCYPGQEVISRLRSIGRVNRLLKGFVADAGGRLAPGMLIHKEGEDGEGGDQAPVGGSAAPIGRITSAVIPPDGTPCQALGYLPRGTGGPLCALDPLTGGRTPISIVAIHGT